MKKFLIGLLVLCMVVIGVLGLTGTSIGKSPAVQHIVSAEAEDAPAAAEEDSPVPLLSSVLPRFQPMRILLTASVALSKVCACRVVATKDRAMRSCFISAVVLEWKEGISISQKPSAGRLC